MFTTFRHIIKTFSKASPSGKVWRGFEVWRGLLVYLLLFSSCAGNEPEQPAYDSEVTVSVRMDDGAGLKSKLSDPGKNHGENTPQWRTIGIYLAYTNGRVLSYQLSREEYEQKNPVAFNAYEGTLTVYAVAFGGEQTFKEVKSVDELKALTTLSLEEVPDGERRTYMQSLFSGKSGANVIVANGEEGAPTSNRIDVTLYRLMTKIDVQYDVQDAYEDGGYTQAVMSQIKCKGIKQGYFFPEEAGGLLNAELEAEQTFTGSAVSGRNGRAYFYTFPGVANQLEFEVAYVDDEGLRNQEYRAEFQQTLERNTWHYVQFNVKGTTASVEGPTEIRLTSPPEGEQNVSRTRSTRILRNNTD